MQTHSFFSILCFLIATATNPFIGFSQTRTEGPVPSLHQGWIDLPDKEEMLQHHVKKATIEPWNRPIGRPQQGRGDIPTEGLRGYWPFNGNANDESGNGNNGTTLGTTLTADRFGNPNSAYDFADSYGILVDNPTGFQLSAWTVGAWINSRTVPPSGSIIVSKEWDSNYNTNFGYLLLWTMEVLPGYETCTSEEDHHVFGAYINTNAWYFAVMTRDDVTGDFSVYINGELTVSGNWSDPPCANVARLWIGPVAPDDFDGMIDDVRIYDRALSNSEILELYNETPEDPLAQFGVHYGSTGSAEPTHPGALITIDPLTGAGTLVGPTGIIGDDGPAVRALAVKSTGEMYAMNFKASSDLYTVNASTGAGTFVANTGLLHPGDIVFDANDVLYAVDETNILYTVDPVTGLRTVVGPTGVTLGGLAYDPTDGTVYGSDNNDGIYTINVTTGAATLIGTTGLGGNTPDILFDQAGNLFGVKKGTGGISNYIAIDKTTGAGTVIGPTGFIAVVGLASRVLSTPLAMPVTIKVEIDSLHQFVPAEGDTFAYTMTFTNHTGKTQVFDWWTKLLRPAGEPIDPLSGPHSLSLSRFQAMVIDTALLRIPFNSETGDYSLVGYVGTYAADTVDADTASFSKLVGGPLALFGVPYGSTGSAEPTNPGALIRIDPVTGAGTLIGPTGIIGDNGPSVGALAIKSTGEMYALSSTASSDLYTVNASTGAATLVANTGLLHPGDIVFNASDILYAVDETNILYTVDPVTGARTVVGPTGVTLGGLACDPTDGMIYGSNNTDGIYTINVTTGAATLVGTTGLGGSTPDILFDQAGNLFGAKSGTGGISNYIAIDKTTGSGTVIGPTGFVAVIGLASRVLIVTSTIPCTDITSMAARCIGGGVKTIQVRVNLLNNIIHAGEEITIAIDENQYTSTIITNGTHSRANFSVPGWSVGDHVVSLVDPPGCLADKHANCVVGDSPAKADPYWDDDAEWMGTAQEVPQTTALLGNYPNPFNPSSNIQYALSEDAQVTLRVYNMLGQLVATLVDEPQTAGYKSVVWNGRNDAGTGVASGIYIYRMSTGKFTETKRMLLLK